MPELRAMPETRVAEGLWEGGGDGGEERNSGKQKREEAISRRRTKEKGETSPGAPSRLEGSRVLPGYQASNAIFHRTVKITTTGDATRGVGLSI